MRLLPLTVLLALIPGSLVDAAPCVFGSLEDYIALGGGGCEIEDKTVSGFLDLGVPGSATPILPADIQVTPLLTPGNPGLTFGFGVTAGAGGMLESLFAFSVAVLPGGLGIEAVSLSLLGSVVVPFGANTALLCFGTTDPGCPTPDPILLFDVGFDSLLTDSREFPPVMTLDLLSDIVVDGGLDGSASLSSATIRFREVAAAPVPEPVLWLPVGAVLFALGLIGRPRGR
jgi:hypothetical protein